MSAPSLIFSIVARNNPEADYPILSTIARRPASAIRTRATSIDLPPGDHALGLRRRKPGAD
jgi:hypothetical protein